MPHSFFYLQINKVIQLLAKSKLFFAKEFSEMDHIINTRVVVKCQIRILYETSRLRSGKNVLIRISNAALGQNSSLVGF
jgi:hypothetical protein